jgi:anaerobic dimethyl sulfoxide reductase subunit A
MNMLNTEMVTANLEPIINRPMFEARSSFQLDADLCRLAGANPRLAEPMMGHSTKEWVFYNMANMTVAGEDRTAGSREALIRFDRDDLNKLDTSGLNLDVEALTTQGRISYKEFKKRGFYQVRRTDRDKGVSGYLVSEAFNKWLDTGIIEYDMSNPWAPIPISVPLDTETGKLEIYSQNLVNYYNNFGFETYMNPICKYQGTEHGFEGTKIPRDGVLYDMQYVGIHPLHRVHSSRTDNRHINEVFDDIFFINPLDAEKAGLKSGDTALLTNYVGKILRRVSVTPTVMPGVIISTQGATTRLLDDEASTQATNWNEVVDYGGNANTVAASLLVGQAHQAYNTVIVKMEKWTGEPLKPQYKWDSDVPKFG